MKAFLCCILIIISLNSFSQVAINNETKFLHQGNYLDISAGISSGLLRDIVTSPLYYTALMPVLNIDYSLYHKKNIFNFNFITLDGLLINSTNNTNYIATGLNFDFNLSYFRQFPEISTNNLNNYVGVSAGNLSFIYINNEFMNAAFTVSNISDISLWFKTEYSIFKASKEKKFLWLFKYRTKEKQYLLSSKIGLPAFAIFYRPDFTNPGNATVNNDNLFHNYSAKTKAIPGMAFDISFSRVLKNGNMLRLGYYWDFITSGKNSINRLELSHHVITFGLIYKIN